MDAASAASTAGWLYLSPGVDRLTSARQLTEADVERVGGWPVEALRSDLMPWLVSRGYASSGDAAGLGRFECLAAPRGGAHLRMAMRLSHACDPEDAAEVERLADDVRELLGEPAPR